MKAIEIAGQIDENGLVKIDNALPISNRRVKIIILMPDEDEIADEIWLQTLAKNEAFDFLKHNEEDIYSINDGEPFRDET